MNNDTNHTTLSKKAEGLLLSWKEDYKLEVEKFKNDETEEFSHFLFGHFLPYYHPSNPQWLGDYDRLLREYSNTQVGCSHEEALDNINSFEAALEAYDEWEDSIELDKETISKVLADLLEKDEDDDDSYGSN